MDGQQRRLQRNVDAGDLGLALVPGEGARLRAAGELVKKAAQAQCPTLSREGPLCAANAYSPRPAHLARIEALRIDLERGVLACHMRKIASI